MRLGLIILVIFIGVGIFQALTLTSILGNPCTHSDDEIIIKQDKDYQGWGVEKGYIGYEVMILPFMACAVCGIGLMVAIDYEDIYRYVKSRGNKKVQ